jgi:hypothetical protein
MAVGAVGLRADSLPFGRHASLERTHVEPLGELEPVRLGVHRSHPGDFAHARVGQVPIDEGPLDPPKVPQGTADADALARLARTQPEETPDSVQLVGVGTELGVLPRLHAVGQVGQVATDQALGPTLGHEQTADFGNQLRRGEPGAVVAFTQGRKAGGGRTTSGRADAGQRCASQNSGPENSWSDVVHGPSLPWGIRCP